MFALKHCHTRTASLQPPHSVQNNTGRRVARCAVASNVMCALCNRLERHAAAFFYHAERAVNTLQQLLARRRRCTKAIIWNILCPWATIFKSLFLPPHTSPTIIEEKTWLIRKQYSSMFTKSVGELFQNTATQ